MRLPTRVSRRTVPLAPVPCAVCGEARDWIVLGWDERERELWSWVDAAAVPADLMLSEITFVCRNGHGMTALTNGRPASEVLARDPFDVHTVAAVWASVASGKTMMAKRLASIIVPAVVNGRVRRAQLTPCLGIGFAAGIPMEPYMLAEPTYAITKATMRAVLETYVDDRTDPGTKPEQYVDDLLKKAGATSTNQLGEVVADPTWGGRKHPLMAWHRVDRDGQVSNASLYLLDEAGEMQQPQGAAGGAVDRRTQQATLRAREARRLLWLVDPSISATLLRWVQTDGSLTAVTRESYRPQKLDGVPQPVDLAAASSQRIINSANALSNTIVAAGETHVPVGVVITKLDLVAQVLRLIEQDDRSSAVPALRRLLGERLWEDAVELAVDGLQHLAVYWLDPARAHHLDDDVRCFLTDLVQDRTADEVGAVVEAVVHHFGTSDSFWALVNGARAHTFEIRTDALTTWTITSIDAYRDSRLQLDCTPPRVTLRDLVSTVMGRVLVCGDYHRDQINSLCLFVPEQFFLISLLTHPFVGNKTELEAQLRLDDNATTGLKHLFYWLLEPMLRKNR